MINPLLFLLLSIPAIVIVYRIGFYTKFIIEQKLLLIELKKLEDASKEVKFDTNKYFIEFDKLELSELRTQVQLIFDARKKVENQHYLDFIWTGNIKLKENVKLEEETFFEMINSFLQKAQPVIIPEPQSANNKLPKPLLDITYESLTDLYSLLSTYVPYFDEILTFDIGMLVVILIIIEFLFFTKLLTIIKALFIELSTISNK